MVNPEGGYGSLEWRKGHKTAFNGTSGGSGGSGGGNGTGGDGGHLPGVKSAASGLKQLSGSLFALLGAVAVGVAIL